MLKWDNFVIYVDLDTEERLVMPSVSQKQTISGKFGKDMSKEELSVGRNQYSIQQEVVKNKSNSNVVSTSHELSTSETAESDSTSLKIGDVPSEEVSEVKYI